MARSSTINVSIDADIKNRAEQLFSQFGISVSDAVSIFLHQSLIDGGFPFSIKMKAPNAETIAAIEESKHLLYSDNATSYSSFAEILQEVENEVFNTTDF